MKNILGFNTIEKSVSGIEFLNESEMLIIRGGTEPTKPISRPKDVYDFEDE